MSLFISVWYYSQICRGNFVNFDQVPIYGQFGPKGPNFNPAITMIIKSLLLKQQTPVDDHIMIWLMPEISKVYMYIVMFVTTGVEY